MNKVNAQSHTIVLDAKVDNLNKELKEIGSEIKYFRESINFTDWLIGNSLSNYHIGRITVSNSNQQVISDDVYIPNADAYLKFLAAYGQTQQGNIYDFDVNGVVGTSDLLRAVGAYGLSCPVEFPELNTAQIFGQFSSGWFMAVDGWAASFIKVTPADEADNSFTPDPINTFFLEGQKGGLFYKIYYYS